MAFTVCVIEQTAFRFSYKLGFGAEVDNLNVWSKHNVKKEKKQCSTTQFCFLIGQPLKLKLLKTNKLTSKNYSFSLCFCIAAVEDMYSSFL